MKRFKKIIRNSYKVYVENIIYYIMNYAEKSTDIMSVLFGRKQMFYVQKGDK